VIVNLISNHENMICPICKAKNPEGNQFCSECGARFSKICPKCKVENPPNANFCGKCGHDIHKIPDDRILDYEVPDSYTPKFLADKILTTRSSIVGERKLVTVLFSDVANFTDMSEKLDPEEVHQVMDGCFKILLTEIHSFEGTINQFTGDGVMALFGAPIAHEDHAQRACRAALNIQNKLASYSRNVETDFGIEFKMRIGLNTGSVFVGSIGDDLRMDYTAIGDTTNLAARLQQSAIPGEVWISAETYHLCYNYFNCEALGIRPVKGKAQPQKIYRLNSEKTGVRTRFEAGLERGVTEFVGRHPELESLQESLCEVKQGKAQIVDIMGEAGVGKSRLVYEFKNSLDGDVTFLPGLSVQYGRNINFLPLIDLTKAAFKIEEDMTDKQICDLIKNKATDKMESLIPFYLNLLSVDVDDQKFKALSPEGRKYGTFEAIKNLMFNISEHATLIVFLEDIHWIDKISEEFFSYLTRSFSDQPILLLSAYRPEIVPHWSHGINYKRLELQTLNSDLSIRLLRNILGGMELEKDLEEAIVSKTGGNPFFVEEIVRELLDRGDIMRKDDHYVCKRSIDHLSIPTTVKGVLAARIDRLSEELKETMQVASVIGRNFAHRLIKYVMEIGTDLERNLNNLVELEILYEKTLYPELEYIFKHALTQEVAYDSILKKRRHYIHEKIAAVLEKLYSDRLEEHVELIAHHYHQSGNTKKAVEYLVLAGEKSKKNKAAVTACDFFKEVLRIKEDKELDLDPKTAVKVHHGLATSLHDMGNIKGALAEYNEAIKISKAHRMVDREMNSLAERAWTLWFTPISTMREEVIRYHDEGLKRVREVGNKAVESRILAAKGFYTCNLAKRFEGNRIIVDAERMALETGNQQAIYFTRFLRATSERWLGRPHKTIELTEGLVEAQRNAYNLANLFALIFIRGLALGESGRIEEGISILKEGIEMCEKLGGNLHLGRLYNGLGYCYKEIYINDRAYLYNSRSEEIGRDLMEKFPSGRSTTGEIVAQAKVNMMENLFDKENLSDASDQIKLFSQESKDDNYDRARDRWEVRMEYLLAKIHLMEGEYDPAEKIILKNLKKTRKDHSKKMEGGFMRLLGEIKYRNKHIDGAIETLSESISILNKIGNPRTLWEAHAALAKIMQNAGKNSEARTNWNAAASIIKNVSQRLFDKQLREGFLQASPVREILSNAD
jgi:class 3 adenylate cyclase/tetratricopeptide (TPR) repeat protein